LPQITALDKGVFWGHTGNDHTKISFSLSRVHDDHKQRRRPWELAFSTPALDKFDRAIQEVISIFLQKTKDRKGDPVEITSTISRLSFDIMGLVGYGYTFENTAKEISHPGLLAMRKAHAMFGQLRWAPWLMTMLGALPGGSDFTPFLKLCADVVHERQTQHKANKLKPEQEEENKEFKDVMAYLLEAMDNGGREAPPTEEALGGESRVMIAAGADTTQSAAANALWYLAATPSALRKLQLLLDDLFPEGPDSFSYAKLIADKEVVSWTDAIINETLRLRSPNLTGLPRATGPDGMLIPESEFGPEVWIPGGVEVLAPTWTMQRDARSFERPDEFLPARWSKDSRMLCNQGAFFPFYIGESKSRSSFGT
jgi:cytochrome P450